VQLGIC